MADVFVSYARPDEPRAQQVAEALRAEGYEAWRDDELPAHRTYAGANIIRLAAKDPHLDNLRSDPRFREMLLRAEERCRFQAALSPPALAAVPSTIS